jgi:flagellar basal-body rod protein FlgC
MTIFPVFQTASSALHTNRVWMDAVADNLANINTINPYDQPAFQSRNVIAHELPATEGEMPGVGSGVAPIAVAFGDGAGRLRYEPGHPYANADGMVRYPDIDLSDQMTQLIVSQRAYQLNLAVVDRARDSYLQALQISGR